VAEEEETRFAAEGENEMDDVLESETPALDEQEDEQAMEQLRFAELRKAEVADHVFDDTTNDNTQSGSDSFRFLQTTQTPAQNNAVAGQLVPQVNATSASARGVSHLKPNTPANADPVTAATGVTVLSGSNGAATASACVGLGCAAAASACGCIAQPVCACRPAGTPAPLDPSKLTLIPKQSRTVIIGVNDGPNGGPSSHSSHSSSHSSHSSSGHSSSSHSGSHSGSVTFHSSSSGSLSSHGSSSHGSSSSGDSTVSTTFLRPNSVQSGSGSTLLTPVSCAPTTTC